MATTDGAIETGRLPSGHPYARIGSGSGLPNVRHIEYPDAGHTGPGAVFAHDACAFLAAHLPSVGAPDPDTNHRSTD